MTPPAPGSIPGGGNSAKMGRRQAYKRGVTINPLVKFKSIGQSNQGSIPGTALLASCVLPSYASKRGVRRLSMSPGSIPGMGHLV